MVERAAHFDNGKGVRLSGILHLPDGNVADRGHDLGVVWLSAGQKPRQGAWRMNVEVARSLAARGVPVLRFDFSGVGDSGGDHRHGDAVMDFYGFIQSGGYADEAVTAVRYFLAEANVKRVVIGGLCGGAITGLFAATKLTDTVAGHILIDLPVTISSSARQKYLEAHADELLRARPGEADTVLLLYLRKLIDPEAWRRLFSGESDYKLIAEMARIKGRGYADRALARAPESLRARVSPWVDRFIPPPPPPEPVAPPDAATVTGADAGVDPTVAAAMQASGEVKNEQVATVFWEALSAGQKVRFLNSSAYHPTFMGYFGNGVLSQHTDDDWARRGVKLTVAEHTNHIFSIDSAQQSLFDAVDDAVRSGWSGLPQRSPLDAGRPAR